MNDIDVKVYAHSSELPPAGEGSLFHSEALFRLYELTPRHKPYMVVATASDGTPLARLLATTRWRWSLFPPYVYRQCRAIGEGDYVPEAQPRRAELFAAMLQALDKAVGRSVLYVEFSNLGSKMFAYKEFRRQGYFPVRWLSVHNSLHSRTPEERIDERTLGRIRRAEGRGVVTTVVEDEADFLAFMHLLRGHNRLKPRRYIPDDQFFRGMVGQGAARLFLTRYHGHAIGCCACAYSGSDAYLWYMASLRKTFARLHPDAATVWAAIKDAHARGYAHIRFMDVGLPFRKNPFRRFVLSFGGKPTATFRWFRFTIAWLNRLLAWIYRA